MDKFTVKKAGLGIGILLYGGLLLLLEVEAGAEKAEGVSGQEYVVSYGDTLWGIAERHQEQAGKRDVREMVYTLRKINALDDGYLHPGQKLILPETW